MTGNCQRGFLNGKSCLTNPIAFYDEMSGLVDKGRAVYVHYFDFSKVFEIILHSVLTKKMRKKWVEERTARPWRACSKWPCFDQGGLPRWPPEVPDNLSDSVIVGYQKNRVIELLGRKMAFTVVEQWGAVSRLVLTKHCHKPSFKKSVSGSDE